MKLSPELIAHIGALLLRETCEACSPEEYAKGRRMQLEWTRAFERQWAEEREIESAQEHMLAVRQAG
ncbi:MAG: hypothetical protein KGI71_04250 [Patescibacteria group bacterium]|nr:hypothetical protein [Patescibacteria group bacterium]